MSDSAKYIMALGYLIMLGFIALSIAFASVKIANAIKDVEDEGVCTHCGNCGARLITKTFEHKRGEKP